MIKFNFDNKGVSISSKDMKEFQENVMTVEDIVNRLLKFYSKDKTYMGEQKQMLTSFFNDPNRRSLVMTEPSFDTLNYGYGVADNKLHKRIMWRGDNGLPNCAMYLTEINKIPYFEGCDEHADNYVYQTKLKELDDEIENIKNQRTSCKNEMKSIQDRYAELLTYYVKMKVKQVKLQIERETLVNKHKK